MSLPPRRRYVTTDSDHAECSLDSKIYKEHRAARGTSVTAECLVYKCLGVIGRENVPTDSDKGITGIIFTARRIHDFNGLDQFEAKF